MACRAVRLAVVMIALSLAAHADDWTKQFTVSAKPELQVNANDAQVVLNAWDKNQIEVRVHTVGYSIPQQLKVTADQAGNKVHVDLHAESRVCFGICVLRIEVTVNLPKNSTVNVRTSDGRIEANDLSGDIRLNSGDGRITGHHLSGNLNAETSDGHIEVDGRFDVLRIRSGDGHVSVKAEYGSKMAGDWSIVTSDGRIELDLPADLAANLDAHTDDGHLDSELPIEMQGSTAEGSLRGKLNGGGPRLEVHTSDGSIHLRKAVGSL